jgi:SAM-dependent methyltransferase
MNEVKINNLYTTNEYIRKNPTLHEEDSSWKVEKIIPLVDIFIRDISKKEIKILDVGGGAGLILSAVATYIRKKGIKVKKYSLDLSSGMLKIQEKNNPDLIKSLNEDISKTSLTVKEVDLTLMIDVLEHIPKPEIALKELRRISRYVIFKVPLEDSLGAGIINIVNRGKSKEKTADKFGHVNFYNYGKLKRQIENISGKVIYVTFADYLNYFLNDLKHKGSLSSKDKILNPIKKMLFNISPRSASYLFFDFIMVLSKSYDS